jgi:hypothetical protein
MEPQFDSGYVTFEERWPHYYSTYCIHQHHDNCRLTCKVCASRCRCSCHEDDGSDRIAYIELRDEDDNVIGTYDRNAEHG